MRAILLREHGGPDVLQPADLPVPSPVETGHTVGKLAVTVA
ncbi:MAG TPA: hypothetical protein VN962_04030 [Polyangia bacterium]|nr:hypothetical protein [Polyangia bacterium]